METPPYLEKNCEKNGKCYAYDLLTVMPTFYWLTIFMALVAFKIFKTIYVALTALISCHVISPWQDIEKFGNFRDFFRAYLGGL